MRAAPTDTHRTTTLAAILAPGANSFGVIRLAMLSLELIERLAIAMRKPILARRGASAFRCRRRPRHLRRQSWPKSRPRA